MVNSFQRELTKEMIDIASPLEVGDVVIQITKGPSEVTVEIMLKARAISFWIYEDEASILGEDIDERFEVPEYRNSSELAESFLRHAVTVVKGR